MAGIVFCALGGALGAVARYWVSGLIYRQMGSYFPWGTFAVNLLGSFFIGILWGVFESTTLTTHMRMFLFIGFLGAFTTFSTFALENFHLMRDGQTSYAMVNIVMSNLCGIILVCAGYFLTRTIVNIIQ